MDPHSQSVSESLDWLAKEQDKIREVGLRMVQAEGGALYTIDLVAVAALNRAAALLAAFGLLLERRNHVSAAAILRMQLDNALRFSSLLRVEDANAAATAILRGTRVKDLIDREGKKLTDSRLVELFADDKDWVPEVYERTSGYIHFSDAHIASAIFPSGTSEGGFRFKIGAEDEDIPDGIYQETIAAFWAATDLFLELVERWTREKETVEGMRRTAQRVGDAPRTAHPHGEA